MTKAQCMREDWQEVRPKRPQKTRSYMTVPELVRIREAIQDFDQEDVMCLLSKLEEKSN